MDTTPKTSVLNPDDLSTGAIKRTLETLVVKIPETFRRQLDRCFLLAFEQELQAAASSEEGLRLTVPYFTEEPQTTAIHRLGYTHLCFIVFYAGSLGTVIRETRQKPGTTETICREAREAFNRRLSDRPIPPYDRPDLVAFAPMSREMLETARPIPEQVI